MLSTEHQKWIIGRGLGRRALVGTAVAVIGVSACFAVASMTGAALMVAVGDVAPTSVPFGAGVVATAAAGGIAYLLARLAGRAAHPRRVFLLMTMAGLLASAVPPLQAAATPSTAIWLLVIHAVAALALVPVLAFGLPSTRAGSVALAAGTSVAPAGPADGR